ncbi:MAG: YgjV family protein [Candidatus Nanopelagicales bacterium]
MSFYSLGGYTSAVVCLITGTRQVTSIYTSSYTLSQKQKITGFFLLLATGVTWLTWQGPISLLPLMASSISTVSAFFANSVVLRKRRFFSDALWIINAIALENYANLVSSALSVLINGLTLKKNIKYASLAVKR